MKFWTIIVVISLILVAILGYLGFKYISLSKPVATPTPLETTIEPIYEDPDSYEGEIVCLVIPGVGDCGNGFRTLDGEEYVLSFENPANNNTDIGDKLIVRGFLSQDVDENDGYKYLIAKSYIKL